jgi:uncharacterized protein YggE
MLPEEIRKMNRSKVLGFVLIIVALTLGACSPQVAGALTGSEREMITVSGVGRALGDPNVATISVGVNVADEDIARAVAESNDTIEAITQALLGLGIAESDIQTTNFSIWAEEQWDPESGQRREERLYRVDSTLSMKVREVDRVGEVLETSISNGANNIYGLSFGIEDTTALAAEARSQALEDATRRAEEIAQELGVSVGKVITVSETSAATPAFFETGVGYGIGGGGGEPPISEGSMTVTVHVTVGYAIDR